MKVNDFDQIERFFEPIEGSTVPDGVGLEMAIQTLGSVRYVVGSTAEFGFGFPDRFGSDDLVFYLKGVSHTVDRSGYKCACQIVDVYTISPTGQIV